MSGRAYRLKTGEPPKKGIRRAAAGRARSAAEHLQDDASKDLAEAVHGARKDVKKFRSLLRLVRTALGEKAYRRENDRFRSAAGGLGYARDAEAKLECIAKLRDRYEGDFPTRWSLDFFAMLERERDEITRGSVPPEVATAIELLEVGERRASSWKLKGDDFALFEPGLRRAFKRGRKGLGSALGDPTSEEVHEWRKRVKDLWYQLRFLQRIWPEVVEPISEQAHELSSILGDHHDLEVVAQEIERHPELFGGQAENRMLALVRARQLELLDAARPIGMRLYCEKPKRFTARIASYWASA